MNIEFLIEIYTNKSSEYYIVEAWGKSCLIRVPVLIMQQRGSIQYEDSILDRKFKDVIALNKTPIDSNLFPQRDYPPFQLGLTIGSIEKFKAINISINKFLEKCFADNLSFYDLCKMIDSIKVEEELEQIQEQEDDDDGTCDERCCFIGPICQ